MIAQQILPILSSVVMGVFVISVFRRWMLRRQVHFLFWSIGLAMFWLVCTAEVYLAAVGWSAPLFFAWYLFGAALNAAWIGHGTVLLLVRTKWVHLLTLALIAGSLIAAALMLHVMPLLNSRAFSMDLPISEQYRTLMPPINQGSAVRLTTPFFNIYGLITLVGGALWSAWQFLRKRILPNLVLGNVLIAAGALSIAFASTLTRFGIGSLLYVGELAAALLMYTGFSIASSRASERNLSAEPVQAN